MSDAPKICPILNIGWLAHAWSLGNMYHSSIANDVNDITSLVLCKKNNCMSYKDGDCRLMNQPGPTGLSILRAKDLKGDKE